MIADTINFIFDFGFVWQSVIVFICLLATLIGEFHRYTITHFGQPTPHFHHIFICMHFL